jgi:hypothetical protein
MKFIVLIGPPPHCGSKSLEAMMGGIRRAKQFPLADLNRKLVIGVIFKITCNFQRHVTNDALYQLS